MEHFESALSPDGQTLAVSVRAKTTDLWLHRSDGTRQKLVTPGVVSWRPSWMPDGKSLVFSSVGDLTKNKNDVPVYRAPADGSARASLLQRTDNGLWEVEQSRDGAWMVVRKDVMGGDTTLRTVVDMPSVQFALSVALSPDGRWLAFASNESEGTMNVYVMSFSDAQAKFVVSRGGGTEPRWSRDGRELFFESGGMVGVVNGRRDQHSRPVIPARSSRWPPIAGRNRQQYDVSPDGQRFLMIRERGMTTAPTAVYVENWLTELTAKVKRQEM